MRKFLLTAGLLVTSLVASAQFSTSDKGNTLGNAQFTASKSGIAYMNASSDHSSFFLEYNAINPDDLLDESHEDEVFTGFSLGFNKAFSLSSGVPLFLEVGAKLTYAWATIYDEEEEYECGYYDCGEEFWLNTKETVQYACVSVPVNVMYKIALPNTSIVLEPFAGLTFKGNILGRVKMKLSCDACCDDVEDDFDEVLDEYDEDDLVSDFFDKDDMGGKKYTANRFNVGYQFGVNVNFSNYYVGVSYGSDFSDFMSEKSKIDSKLQTTSVTLGLRF